MIPNNCITLYTAVFVVIWFAAWMLNAVFNMNFDLDRLKELYIWLATQLNATHAINSIWNSPKGCHPDQPVQVNDSDDKQIAGG